MQPLRKMLQRPFPYRQYNITTILIGINVGVYVITSFAGRYLLFFLSMSPLMILRGALWQFITYFFIHYGFFHLFFNMLGLYFFGMQVERVLGSWEFLLFYLLIGFLAGVFSFFSYTMLGGGAIRLAGSSGAVFAVLLAFAVLYPDARIFIFGIFPIKAANIVLLYTGIEVFSQLRGGSNIAHLTHLAGFAWALLYFYVRLNINPIQRLFNKYR